MYIQPYEARELSFGASSFAGYPASNASAIGESDAIDRPWTDSLPEFSDTEAALDDGPLGQFGLAPMLQNLTGMMQQLVQMMQSLLGRMNGGSELPGMLGSSEPRRVPEENCGGCTQLPRGSS